MNKRIGMLLLAFSIILPAAGHSAGVSDAEIASLFRDIGVSAEVPYSSVQRTPWGNQLQTDSLRLFEVIIGTPAWQELGLPKPILPEPWPTPVEYKVSSLGRQLYAFLNKLTPKQREVLKARMARPGAKAREVEEIVRLLQAYLIPMGKDKGGDGNTHAALFPEDYKAFYDQALSIIASIPEEEDPNAPAAARPPVPSVRTTEEVLRVAKTRARVQQGLIRGREFLGSLLSGGENAAAAQLERQRAAGANEEEIHRLQAGVKFMNWINGPKTREALSADPEKMDQLERVIGAIDDLTKPGADGSTSRQEALYPLVKFINESRLTEDQWKGLIDKFPMGDSINRLGWAKLWRAGIDGRLEDGTELVAGLIGSGIDERHPMLKGRVKHSLNLTYDRRLSPDGISVPEPRGEHETQVASVVLSAMPLARVNSYKNLEEQGTLPPWRRIGAGSQIVPVVAASLEAALRDGVAAINLSQGSGSGIGHIRPDGIRDAVNATMKAGVPVVVSAGNSGPGTQALPAAVGFSVGSVDSRDRSSRFSSESDAVVRDADGSIRVITTPMIMAPGEFVMAKADLSGKYDDPKKLFAPSQGTSFSSPWVTASMLALEQVARRRGVAVTPEEKMEILITTGKRVEAPLHPMGIMSLNPVAAVEELERRIAERKPNGEAAPVSAEAVARRQILDVFHPTRFVTRLVRALQP